LSVELPKAAMKKQLLFPVTLALLILGFYQARMVANEADGKVINYSLRVDEHNYEFFTVQISLEPANSRPVIFRMPRWAPGAYRIRDYAGNVRSFRAFNEKHQELSVQKISSDGWQVVPLGRGIRVEYEVEPAYESWSQVALDSAYALVEAPAVFMYVEGETDRPILVSYTLPRGWKVASPLQPKDKQVFYADNYDIFVDAPTQLGNLKGYRFTTKGVPIDLVFHGDIEFAADSFQVMVEKICEYQTDLFGEAPFERFVFFYKLLDGPYGGGGLEHANSTTIGLSSERLAENILSAAEVTAHEFFHVWNVKRIRPTVFTQFDYTKEARTKSLWFLEGVTSYYEALTLVRTRLWNEQIFLDELERQIEMLQETAERKKVSVEQASWQIWERGYSHIGLSFYNKGELLGLLLDLKIRHDTHNRFSLDDLLLFMNWWFAKQNIGFEEEDIRRAVNAISRKNYSLFFENYVAGTEELPYAETLNFAGLNVSIASDSIPSIGDIIFVGPRNRVVFIADDSPAKSAGLLKGDYLLELGGASITSHSQLNDLVNQYEFGSKVELKVLRTEEELNLPVTIGKKVLVDCEIEPIADPTELQLTIRKGWLQGWTGKPLSTR
jgi:predicted metalloprotease with PDZ domain